MNITTDNYFTYRQIPVSYKGMADITSIKGNTVVFNQQIDNGNFASTTGWLTSNSSISVSSNEATVTYNQQWASVRHNCSLTYGHKYYIRADIKMSSTGNTRFGIGDAGYMASQGVIKIFNPSDTNYHTYETIGTFVQVTGASATDVVIANAGNSSRTANIKNVMVIDLTQMFGSGNEPTIDEFTSLFPLPYYSYNTGELVSFRGTGLKTVGFNQWDEQWANGYFDPATGQFTPNASNTQIASKNYNPCLPNTTYCFHQPIATNPQIYMYDANKNYISRITGIGSKNGTFTTAENCHFFKMNVFNYGAGIYNNDICINISSSENGTYKPYFTDTLSLPVSTYFPTGMKSAGSVYDELTQSKAITRIGAVDLGNLTWTRVTTGAIPRFVSNAVTGIKAVSSNNIIANIICQKYTTSYVNDMYDNGKDNIVAVNTTSGVAISDSSYSDAATFTTAMSGVYLYYELATPTETDVSLSLTYNIEPNGTEEIYPTALYNGWVDLGSLTWEKQNTTNSYRFRCQSLANGDILPPSANGNLANIECSAYDTISASNTYAWTSGTGIAVGTDKNIYVYDTSYSDATAFKNAMDGVILYYQRDVSTPYTSPILANITYYNTTDSAVPYRKFWIINAKGERWNLTERDLKTFLNNPQGLGFAKTLSVSRYGNTQMLIDSTDNFPNPQGDILFYDSSNKTRYERYNDFVRFLSYFPVTLYYQIPATYYSRIPDIYSLECEVLSLTKTESKPEHILTAQISMNGLSFYKGDEVIINGTGSSYTIENPSDFPVGFEITITGTSMENPYFTLEQDNSLYGEAKFNDIVGFDSVYVNSNDGEQYIELQQGGSVLSNPLLYQDLSISNGAIYVTFVALARGTSTLTIGMDSGSITSANIKFTPLYRSV